MNSLPFFNIVVATTKYNNKYGIGNKGKLPWKYNKEDMNHFYNLTKNNVIIMGRGTWESIGSKPLNYRVNAIISNQLKDQENVLVFKSLNESLKELFKLYPEKKLYVIGGEQLYKEALEHPLLQTIHLTMVENIGGFYYECDKFLYLNEKEYDWRLSHIINEAQNEGVYNYFYDLKPKINQSEQKYLEVLKKLTSLPSVINRTKVGCKSTFSVHLKYPLSDSTIPLFTTKFVSYKTVLHELVWFISGSNNIKYLKENGVKIWDGNTSREYLDSIGHPEWEEGTSGKAYPVQLRNFTGVDQLKYVINNLRNNPFDRRHVISFWNPPDLNQCCLPPCHILYVWNVEPDSNGKPKWLNGHVTLRSNDMFLGHPFNVATLAFFTHLFAKLSGLEAKEISLLSVNCHLYDNAVDAALEQCKREPISYPKIKLNNRFNRNFDLEELETISISDFEIANYFYGKSIKADMVV
jgi:thymidylate synthase